MSRYDERVALVAPTACSAPRGRSSMVELQLPKLTARVRFPSPAPFVLQGGATVSGFTFLFAVFCLEGFEPVVGLLPVAFNLLVFSLVNSLVECQVLRPYHASHSQHLMRPENRWCFPVERLA